MRILLSAFFVIVIGASRNAHAADTPGADDKALPCRPTIACTAELVPPGTFEVEAGALFRRLGPPSDRARQWTFPFLAKLTLEKWIQVQVGSNGYTTEHGGTPTDRAQYFDDVQGVAKFHFVDQTPIVPSVSLSISANVPTAASPGYDRTYDLGAIAYVTKDIGALHADLNLGLNALRLSDEVTQTWVALAISTEPIKGFGAMVEGYLYSTATPVLDHDGGLLFALSHSPKPWLVFDAGGDIGTYPSARAYSVFFGVTIIPVVLWRAPRPPHQ